jgi:hypothetical protein
MLALNSDKVLFTASKGNCAEANVANRVILLIFAKTMGKNL